MSIAAAALAIAAFAQQAPWPKSDLMEPGALAARLQNSSSPKPNIIYVGFPVLYRASHIPGAVLAGPASKAAGLEALRAAVSKLPKDAEIVIYCGCCPFDQCPNIRPAYAELHKMGFSKIKIVDLPNRFASDWVDKHYPVDRGE
jgi:hypothetical protein